ncbi:hypothetical protein GFL54_10825 [Rhizobium laguerreae]|nr:hypothetical protein [Rhizobium laguerreae]
MHLRFLERVHRELDRWFPKLKDQSDTSGMFWRYIALKAATNPSGTVVPGMSCSAIDQGEYVYD